MADARAAADALYPSTGRATAVPTSPTSGPLAGRARVHPWLHVDARGVIVGRVTDAGQVQLVTSERVALDPADVKGGLLFPPRVYPDLAGRWRDADAEEWLATGQAPTVSEALALLLRELEAAVEFLRPEHAALVAVWGLASYFHRLFLTFPRLQLVGERGCGKSKVLAMLQAVAWNASLSLTPTPAVLYRLVQETRPTLLLDECEGLAGDDRREILAVVNSGYKRGACVPRCEGERTKRVEFFDVFAPLALAGLKGLNPTTEDRCIPLVMQRGTNRARVNKEVDPAAPTFARIRAAGYRLWLTRWEAVANAYGCIPFPAWLNGRARELWKPLLAVAQVADRENGLAVTPDLLALAREHVEDRADLSAEGEALLAVLAERLSGDATNVRPGDLCEELRKRLGWRDAPTPEQVSAWLRRFGFRRGRRDRSGAWYEIRAEQLQQVMVRFTPETTVTPSASHSS